MTGRVLAVLVGGALLVVALVVVGVGLLRGPSAPDRVVAPPAASLAPAAQDPQDFAEAACVRLRLAVQGISAGSAAETVRAELAAARVLAAEALRGDGAYADLSGGLAALDEAVRVDDPDAAATGVRVAQAACEDLP